MEEKIGQIRVDLEKTREIRCECGNNRFTQAFFVREIPSILIGKKDPEYINIPVFECSHCGAILDKLVPEVFRNSI